MIESTYKYARISAKKGQDMARIIRGMDISEAIEVLSYTPKKAAQLLLKTLNTAIANAENNHEIDTELLYISHVTVNQGPTFKRFRPRARGSASKIRKRTSHINIILDYKKDNQEEEEEKISREEEISHKNQTPKKEIITKNDNKRGLIYTKAPKQLDDLKKISGVGKILEKKLNDFGIYKFEQIANWKKINIDEFDQLLDFHGRIEREDWVAQTKKLHQEKIQAIKNGTKSKSN